MSVNKNHEDQWPDQYFIKEVFCLGQKTKEKIENYEEDFIENLSWKLIKCNKHMHSQTKKATFHLSNLIASFHQLRRSRKNAKVPLLLVESIFHSCS